jgi:Zn-dependent peptidase ImmA (M78 family)
VNRLRAYRDIEGINQEELGKLLGLSPSMVSAIEAGRREFGSDLNLIGYAPRRLLLPPMTDPLHRFRAATPVVARKRAHELLRLAGEVFKELRERTPKAPNTIIERRLEDTDLDELTAETRCLLQHEESGPIRNLTAAIERAGVCIVPIVGLAGVDGLSSWVDGVPVIGVSPSVPGDRFRLTLAHEVGHLTKHVRKSDTTESEANAFASTLLFPTMDFEAALPERPQLRDFATLKSTWGISIAAMVYRAHDMGIIDDARYRALQIQMSKWRRQEPVPFEPVHGSLFAKLVEVNGGSAAVGQTLGINSRHLSILTDWRHLRPA